MQKSADLVKWEKALIQNVKTNFLFAESDNGMHIIGYEPHLAEISFSGIMTCINPEDKSRKGVSMLVKWEPSEFTLFNTTHLLVRFLYP